MAAGEKIKDIPFITEALQELVSSGEEFPIKVEGTKTLPYASILISSQPGTRQVVIKLVRPLPPALAEGALFEMVFATKDKRFEGRITYLGREGYLQYRFQWPTALLASDRRLWKRYPVRPREDLQVAAQDSDIPGHGLAGPLLNLSLGGLAFRVDRMLRLEDGMPVRPGAYLFERGKILSMLRVRGLPKGQVLEARGQIVRVQESHSELQLGIQFSGLGEKEKQLLASFLEIRERQSTQSSGGFSQGTGRIEWPAGAPAQGEAPEADADGEVQLEVELGADLEEPPTQPVGPEEAGLETLLRLDRRSTRLLVISPPGPDRDAILRRLEAAGYLRLEAAAELFEAHALAKAAGPAPFRLLLVDLEPNRAQGLEAMGAVRHLEPLLRSFGELPVAFITRVPDPILELMNRPGLGSLAQEEDQGRDWAQALDGLLGR